MVGSDFSTRSPSCVAVVMQPQNPLPFFFVHVSYKSLEAGWGGLGGFSRRTCWLPPRHPLGLANVSYEVLVSGALLPWALPTIKKLWMFSCIGRGNGDGGATTGSPYAVELDTHQTYEKMK